ncbi:MAG: septum formation initiator family protein [Oscillospiraceae bacterium]|jgi:cell division protein FtsB|nr:septum formation initiator family protein [Oscillospiraceae bacterium]
MTVIITKFLDKINSVVKKAGNKWVLLLCSTAFVMIFVLIFHAFMTVQAKTEELEAIKLEYQQCLERNQEINALLEGTDEELIERIAREEYGYVLPGERIIVVSPGE